MKKTFLVVILTLAGAMVPAEAQGPRTTRFQVVDSTVPSGRILDGLQSHCQNAILTLDASKADYVLQLQFDDNPPNPSTVLTLYDKSGDSLFQTTTRYPQNAIKDACAFLKLGK